MELIKPKQHIFIVWRDEFCEDEPYYMDGTVEEIDYENEFITIYFDCDLVGIGFSKIEQMTLYYN